MHNSLAVILTMEWLTLYKGGTGEIEEKKSRFIATIEPVSSEEEAADFIARIKKKYWDARHNCSAFIIGETGEKTRCSDDGEPSGTAGRPMLDVLSKEGITNACVVVTRYFGGVLLGTGGLTRAYKDVAAIAAEGSLLSRRHDGFLYTISCDYNDYGKVEYILRAEKAPIAENDFADTVKLKAIIDAQKEDRIKKAITDATSAKAKLIRGAYTGYIISDGKPVLI